MGVEGKTCRTSFSRVRKYSNMTRTKVSVMLHLLFVDVILKHTHNSATRATKPICSRKMSKAVCFLRFTYDKAQETITMIFTLRRVLFFSLKKYEGILKVFNYPSLLTRKHHLHHLHRTSTTTCYFTKLPTNYTGFCYKYEANTTTSILQTLLRGGRWHH